jgi:transposase-like protein
LRLAVDQDGDVLDILVQSRRDKKAAKKFFRKLLNGLQYVPNVIITDKLRSYGAAKAEMLRVSIIAKTNGRTTVPRIRISQRDDSSQQVTHSASSPPSELLTHISAWGDICTEPGVTGQR